MTTESRKNKLIKFNKESISGYEVGRDFDILTYDVLTNLGNFYSSIHKMLLAKVDGEFVVETIDNVITDNFIYRLDGEKEINIDLSVDCEFGVLIFTKGAFKGVQFMFPTLDNDNVQLFLTIYFMITNQVLTDEMKYNLTDELASKELKITIGNQLFEQLLQLL